MSVHHLFFFAETFFWNVCTPSFYCRDLFLKCLFTIFFFAETFFWNVCSPSFFCRDLLARERSQDALVSENGELKTNFKWDFFDSWQNKYLCLRQILKRKCKTIIYLSETNINNKTKLFTNKFYDKYLRDKYRSENVGQNIYEQILRQMSQRCAVCVKEASKGARRNVQVIFIKRKKKMIFLKIKKKKNDFPKKKKEENLPKKLEKSNLIFRFFSNIHWQLCHLHLYCALITGLIVSAS